MDFVDVWAGQLNFGGLNKMPVICSEFNCNILAQIKLVSCHVEKTLASAASE